MPASSKSFVTNPIAGGDMMTQGYQAGLLIRYGQGKLKSAQSLREQKSCSVALLVTIVIKLLTQVMAYSDFTSVSKTTKAFGLSIKEEIIPLFEQASTVQPSAVLAEILNENIPLAIATGSEKARSELIISPILVELRKNFQRKISLFSGESFDVDPEKGLNGVCDFLISSSPVLSEIQQPVIVIVEAKKGDFKSALGQCIAEMVGAQIFNNDARAVHGVVTIGTLWRFLLLEEKLVSIDLVEYPLPPIDKILGILTAIILKIYNT